MNALVGNADRVLQVADSTGNRGEGGLCFELFGFVLPALCRSRLENEGPGGGTALRLLQLIDNLARKRKNCLALMWFGCQLAQAKHCPSGEFSRTLLRTQLTVESLPLSIFLPIGARPAILQVDSP